MIRGLFVLALVLVVAVGLSFGVENRHTVTFRYYIGEVEVSLALLMVLTAAAGVLVGMATGLGALWSARRRSRGLRRQLAALQAGARDGRPASTGDAV